MPQSSKDGSATERKDNDTLPAGSSQPRDKNPTRRRAEERLEDKQGTEALTEGKQRRQPAPSDLFNGA